MFNDVGDVLEILKAKNGVMTARLQDVVRAFPPYSNCTEPQVNKVIEKLRRADIGCYPSQIECKPDTVVGLYLLGSPIEILIEAVLQPSLVNPEILRSASILQEAYSKIILSD